MHNWRKELATEVLGFFWTISNFLNISLIPVECSYFACVSIAYHTVVFINKYMLFTQDWKLVVMYAIHMVKNFKKLWLRIQMNGFLKCSLAMLPNPQVVVVSVNCISSSENKNKNMFIIVGWLFLNWNLHTLLKYYDKTVWV